MSLTLYLINWEWKEHARGVSPRSAPLDLSAEAGKCSPGEVTGLSHAVFVWQKACWHFVDVKEQFVRSSKNYCCWQLFHPHPGDSGVVLKRSGQVLPIWVIWVIGFQGRPALQYAGIGFPCRREMTNGEFTGTTIWEQPLTMCRDIVPWQVSSYSSERRGLFLEDASRYWQKLWPEWSLTRWLVYFKIKFIIKPWEHC